MSGLWWTSDEHFGHANIIKYCQRPFMNVQEMDAMMVYQWNRRVQPSDTVMAGRSMTILGRSWRWW